MKTKRVGVAIAAFLMIALTSVGALAVTKKATIRVEGMKCAKCSGSVEKALGRPASASSSEAGPNFLPALANDGNLASRWSSFQETGK